MWSIHIVECSTVNEIILTHHSGAILAVCHTPVLEKAPASGLPTTGAEESHTESCHRQESQKSKYREEAETRLVCPSAAVRAR